MFINFCFLDASQKWRIDFQDPATPIMEGIIRLHDDIFYFLVVILIIVLWFFYKFLINFYYSYKLASNYEFPEIEMYIQKLSYKSLFCVILGMRYNNINHGAKLEFIWTILPSFLLILIASPSFSLLFAFDEEISSDITLKVIGHQWYWSYEFTDYPNYSGFELNAKHIYDFFGRFFEIESYMLMEDEIRFGNYRLLEVDFGIVLPVNTFIRVIVGAADVLHAWAIPSLGIKIDAVPGRLNQVNLFINRQGVYYGQCSEICGVNHGFMPIVIRVVSFDRYESWSEIQSILGKGQSDRVFKLARKDCYEYDDIRQKQLQYLDEFDPKTKYYF